MPVALAALASFFGGLTIELLWAQGALVAFLAAPFVASLGTALSVLPLRWT